MSKRYLCSQLLVMKEEINGNSNDVKMDVLIRNVAAKNKAEAMGKFIIESNKIEARKKLNVDCFLIDDLLKID